ncbi:MAG: ATP-binding protein [Trichlorobacter sp.]|uniref:hybrid sensor histidine kinase/response regulator n=1 Tax=Trichlorobacter sp. TaxID=2911007 RepID=UPI00256B11A9|nr:hybrid sensor histidine kinase/response regulator [Trichlorobacter sp.]MDK9717501.1 ATP-binding protein [Trichlorobacter sp.]
MGTKQILIVSNGTTASQQAFQLLATAPYQLHQAATCEEARITIKNQRLDAILLGSPPHQHCLPSLEHLQESGSDPAVIALLDANEQERYLDCHKQGALDCLMAPFSVERLVKSIERCLAIKSLEREKRDFISMLSHDLKNPLTAAIGSIDLVREKRLGPLNREQGSYLLSAIESCNEVVAMIDNLLDIHRLEAGKLVFHKAPANLSELTQQVVAGFRGMIKHAQIQLHLQLEEDLPLLDLDKNKFSRVIANLLANAVKFTPCGGEITIRCYCGVSTDSKVAIMLSIADTGNGIATVELPIIFDRFVQARNQAGRGSGGSGLGLAFCKMVVEAHDGAITADSREGIGSEFTITLPLP